VVADRAKDLGIESVVQGSRNKLSDYEKMVQQRRLDDRDVAYVADDLVDIPVLRRAGLALAVADASAHVRDYCHACTMSKGGKGAVREVCDFLLQVQGKWEEVTAPYFANNSG
jgi:3-deoxy-D-manno-octulosonate 8-phosphate phosphatase (KDO 8-P phosphatase)